MDGEAVVADLERIVSRERVLRDEKLLEDYRFDALRQGLPGLPAAQKPLAVVRPASTDHVAQIMRLANKTGTPVVPYGAGTGVMGGAATVRAGIVLDMGSMNKVLRVSLEDRSATVQSGVVLAELDSIAQHGNLFLAHDPWSQPVATVGGAISTNGVGYLAGKYGSMGRQVLALEVVLPTGEVVRTRALPFGGSAGLDLNRLFIGTEGTFGVITEATVRLHPVPEERRHYALSFPSFPNGFFAISRLYSEGLVPAMVDFTEEDDADEGEPSILPDGPTRSVMILSLEGLSGEVDDQEQLAWEVATGYGATDMGPEEAQRFWQERHSSGEHYAQERAAGRRHPWQGGGDRAFAYLHTAAPISKVLELRYKAVGMVQAAGLRVRECAIWGEPEMFSIALADVRGGAEGRERVRKVADQILDLALELGGTIEYCHGVGLRLKHVYPRELGEGGAALLRRMKAAVDPAGIMNPGKLID